MRRHCYRKTNSRLNKLLLGNLRTNRERVILPSSQSKIKKKNFSSLTNQHSVILPVMLLALKIWLFRLKYISKLRKHTLINVDMLSLTLSDKPIRHKPLIFTWEILHVLELIK